MFLLLLILVTINDVLLATAASTASPAPHGPETGRTSASKAREENCGEIHRPPNFVIVLTDDLDWTLGGADASTLSKTRRWLGGGDSGKTFENWFVQTPVCCASRAELLTGKMYHNLKVRDENQDGCQHIDVGGDDPQHRFWMTDYFSNYFNNETLGLNYSIGIFGKHFNNKHNPTTFLPNGVDEWLINNGGEYLNPSFTRGRRIKQENKEDEVVIEKMTFDNCTNSTGMPCYSTSVIGNASLAWIQNKVLGSPSATDPKSAGKLPLDAKDYYNPFLALIAVKAPHIQDGDGFPMATPAPWYANASITETMAPRTPNYNFEGKDHHWLVRNQTKLTPQQVSKVDDLYVSRLLTLQSVDDLVEDLIWKLTELGVLEDTYVLFTSDNGYRLGQFRIPMCKLHPYENDVRVPMMIRGPGIGSRTQDTDGRTRSRAIFSHFHIMPTLLGLATGKHDSQDIVPESMDGTNLASWILDNLRSEDTQSNIDDSKAENQFETFRAKAEPTIRKNHTMSVSSEVPLPTPFAASSTSLLIEFTSLGNVTRYQHLIDIYNHSFVALRILPRFPRQSEETTRTTSTKTHPNGSDERRSNVKHQQRARNSSSLRRSSVWIEEIANLKYIEFRDSRVDWNNTQTAPLERELYDLDRDPFEMHNLIDEASPSLLRALEEKTRRMMECYGASCRREHATGIEFFDSKNAMEWQSIQ